MTRRVLVGAMSVFVLACCTGVSAGAAPSARVTPAAAVSPSAAIAGQSVFVSGSTWPGRTEVSVSVCGEEARHGSEDCDLQSSAIIGTDGAGVFGTQVAVQVPPKPCPCVVLISSLESSDELKIPIVIAGAPSAPLPPIEAKKPRPLTIERATLTGGSWTSWFGWSAHRTLVLRVKNTSGAPLNEPLLLVAAGRESNPTEPQKLPVLGPFATDEVRTIRVPVGFGAPSIGDYGVRIRAGANGTTVTKAVGTSSYPWGLFVIALLLVQCVLLVIRNRVRHRVVPDEDEAVAAPEPAVASNGARANGNGSGNGNGNGNGAHELQPIAWKPLEPIRWKMPESSSS